jgi:hypothetical protein
MPKLTYGVLALAAFILAAVALKPGHAPAQEVQLFKDPNCGCCTLYADYLRENGFEVAVTETDDLDAVNREAGVPDRLQSCHVMHVHGYAVGGHVPVEVVHRLLDERPEIRGITLPGMPLGSPGMNGPKSEPFTVYGFDETGARVYAVE